MPEDRQDAENDELQQQEIIVYQEEASSHHHHACPLAEETTQRILQARADVIRLAGFTAALMPPFITFLAFLDALINRHPWQPDERILLAVLAAFGLIAAFAWKTKGD